mmetsp:Transcript_36730/g.72094  ORF Transcript_36730/g.72094 Transcript_36730/m.72094 type:complete len:472 (-) Transcript_36730:235-1650(-)
MPEQKNRSSWDKRRARALEEANERLKYMFSKVINHVKPSAGYLVPATDTDIIFAELLLLNGIEVHLVLPWDASQCFELLLAARSTNQTSDIEMLATYKAVFSHPLTRLHYVTQETNTEDKHELLQLSRTVCRGLGKIAAEDLGPKPAQTVRLMSSHNFNKEEWLLSDKVKKGNKFFDLAGDSDSDEDSQPDRYMHTLRVNADPVPFFVPHVRGISEVKAKVKRVFNKITKAARVARLLTSKKIKLDTTNIPMSRIQFQRKLRYVLFAELHTSHVSDAVVQHLHVLFVRQAKAEVDSSHPDFYNSWGDGVVMAFPDIMTCMSAAMNLFSRVTYATEGFNNPEVSNGEVHMSNLLKVCVHAGLVYEGFDPILKRLNYFGTHMNRPAMLAPLTPPGCCYATEQFAACLSTADFKGDCYKIEFVGKARLLHDLENEQNKADFTSDQHFKHMAMFNVTRTDSHVIFTHLPLAASTR